MLSPYIGFTLPEVKKLCESRCMDYGECLKWYDGYHLADDVSVCDTNSVYRAIRTGEYGNYWTTTGSYVTSPRTYNNEGSLQSAIGHAYVYAQSFYNVVKEHPAGNGYADMAFLPTPRAADKPAIIVELKMDKSTDTALDQIRRRDYPAAIAQYAGEALRVGVSYSRKGKRHACVIEKMTIGDFS